MKPPYIQLDSINHLSKICVPKNQKFIFILGQDCYFDNFEEYVEINGGKNGKTFYEVMKILDKKFENEKLSFHNRSDLVFADFIPSGKNKFRVSTDS